jgi:hypothetical protein
VAEASKRISSDDVEALFDKLGGTIGRTGAPKDVQVTEVRFQCMKCQKDADGNPIKFSWTVDTTTDDSENTGSDNGAREHTGLEPVDYPDQLGGEDDTADRIGPDESEELEDTAYLDASTADYTCAGPAGQIPPELDLPSDEDEVEEDEELRPFPTELKELWTPHPGDLCPHAHKHPRNCFKRPSSPLPPSSPPPPPLITTTTVTVFVCALTHSYLQCIHSRARAHTHSQTHAHAHTHTHTHTHTYRVHCTHTHTVTHARLQRTQTAWRLRSVSVAWSPSITLMSISGLSGR